MVGLRFAERPTSGVGTLSTRTRNPYCQAFYLQGGQIVELHVDAAGWVYLMTDENLVKYCAGLKNYSAQHGMLLDRPIKIVAANTGRWYVVSEHLLQGTYRLRMGADVSEGPLEMRRVRPL
jgi:hypothetical protein